MMYLSEEKNHLYDNNILIASLRIMIKIDIPKLVTINLFRNDKKKEAY
jgi:hypothetical protein